MPRRGHWLPGQLNDKHILEEDLSQALQDKVNAGGGGGTGNREVILDTTAPSNLISHTFNFSRSVAMDGSDIGMLEIIISELDLSVSDVIEIGFNGAIGGMTIVGFSSDGTTVSAVSDTFITDGVSFASNASGSIIIEIPGHYFGGGEATGATARFADNNHYSGINFRISTSGFDPLTSITIRTRGATATINTPTRIVAYAINKD
ncbi:MAG: hypothetical protein V3V41_02110 [Candidatus Heimdallarchaeota archaeon]